MFPSGLPALRALILLALVLGHPAFSVSKNFEEILTGVSMGGGTYLKSLSGSGPQYDPIESLGTSYTSLSHTNEYYLLPLKVGYYVSKPYTQFEVYARHLRSTYSPFYGSGTNEGSGSVRYGGWGAGVELGATMYLHSRFRVSILGVAEYVLQSATATYTPTGGSEETLKMEASTIQAGGGLLGEVYLGDLWMLNLSATYLHGFDAYWKAKSSATFMGIGQTGTLLDGNGDKVKAVFGGVLLEISLRLAFY